MLLAGGPEMKPGMKGDVEDHDDRGRAETQALKLAAHDAMIAVAASGTTRYTLAALEVAKAAGAVTVAIANNPGAPMLNIADHPILLETGAEIISGSTRMNAGTAQKATLGLLSSLTMIRLHRIYDGMMVDMRGTEREAPRPRDRHADQHHRLQQGRGGGSAAALRRPDQAGGPHSQRRRAQGGRPHPRNHGR